MYGKKRSYQAGGPEPDKPVPVRWSDGGQGVLPSHGEHPAGGGHWTDGRAGDGEGTLWKGAVPVHFCDLLQGMPGLKAGGWCHEGVYQYEGQKQMGF